MVGAGEAKAGHRLPNVGGNDLRSAIGKQPQWAPMHAWNPWCPQAGKRRNASFRREEGVVSESGVPVREEEDARNSA